MIYKKMTNLLMRGGERDKAVSILLETFKNVERSTESRRLVIYRGGLNHLGLYPHFKNRHIFALFDINKVLKNISPYLEVRKKRISGVTRQIPFMVRNKSRQEALAIRWLIAGAKTQNSNYTMSESLAFEILEALQKQGFARKKRNELHKVAHSNRAYIRYRWW